MTGWFLLFAAIVYLDTTAAFQFMLCQPAIACPFYGLIVGRPEIGLFFGLTFQLLWLRSLPIGATQFYEGNLGALVATAVAATIPKAPTEQPALLVMAFAALAGLVAAGLGRHLTTAVRQVSRHFSDEYAAAQLQDRRMRGAVLFGGALLFNAASGALFALVLYFVSLQILNGLIGLSSRMPVSPEIVQSSDWLWGGLLAALLGAGAGIAAARFAQRKTAGWAIGGAGIAVGLLWV